MTSKKEFGGAPLPRAPLPGTSGSLDPGTFRSREKALVKFARCCYMSRHWVAERGAGWRRVCFGVVMRPAPAMTPTQKDIV